jgi:hypothetical protein
MPIELGVPNAVNAARAAGTRLLLSCYGGVLMTSMRIVRSRGRLPTITATTVPGGTLGITMVAVLPFAG